MDEPQKKQSLPRTSLGCGPRIKDSAIFAQAIQSRPVGRGQYFFVHHVRLTADTPSLGLIVPKRILKKASSRNATKRVVRESFRHLKFGLPPGSFVVRLKRAPPAGSLRNFKIALRADADLVFKQSGWSA